MKRCTAGMSQEDRMPQVEAPEKERRVAPQPARFVWMTSGRVRRLEPPGEPPELAARLLELMLGPKEPAAK
jgi:hypothetical protein